MVPIISIVGRSNSGKTTLLEKLIKELQDRGYRVAVVKHDIHGFDIDHEGKDSWRLGKAGAMVVVISSPSKVAMIRKIKEETPLEYLEATLMSDVDIILTEGFKRGDKPKIEVFRSELGGGLLCLPEELIAIVSDVKFELGPPCFHLEEIKGLADLIEKDFLSKRRGEGLSLLVNGKEVLLKPFVANFIQGGILGMISVLKGTENPKEVILVIKPKGEAS